MKNETTSLHGLGDDLHEFTEMQAKLADGRLVRVTIDEDGHINIIALLGKGKLRPSRPLPGTITLTSPEGQAIKAPADQMRQAIKEMEDQLEDSVRPNIPPRSTGGPPLIPHQQQQQQQQQQQSGSDPTGANAKQIIDAPPGMSSGVASALDSMLKKSKLTAEQVQALQALPNSGTGTATAIAGVAPAQLPSSTNYQQGATYLPPGLMQLYGNGIGGGIQQEVDADPLGTVSRIPRDSVFAAKLESIMNDNQFDRRLRGRTRGKLDMTRLHKASSGATNLFTQKSLRRNRKYNIAIVVDESGSMYTKMPGKIGGEFKVDVAARVCQFLAEHFGRIPGLDIAVVGFSSAQTVHKRFEENQDLKTLATRIKRSPVRHNNTADHLGLQKAYQLLKEASRNQDHKPHNILLLLTDGDSDNDNLVKNMRNRYKGLATEVALGIGIKPKQMEHSIEIGDLDELKPQIAKVLRTEIKRG